jgi:hypothetical protein
MKKLKKYEFTVTKRGKYPWEKWFNGDILQAVQGEDYTCSSGAFIAAIHHAAKIRGLKARTSNLEQGIVVFQCPIPEGEGDE